MIGNEFVWQMSNKGHAHSVAVIFCPGDRFLLSFEIHKFLIASIFYNKIFNSREGAATSRARFNVNDSHAHPAAA
jgi:hypothetical protein